MWIKITDFIDEIRRQVLSLTSENTRLERKIESLSSGDLNLDGRVDFADFLIFS